MHYSNNNQGNKGNNQYQYQYPNQNQQYQQYQQYQMGYNPNQIGYQAPNINVVINSLNDAEDQQVYDSFPLIQDNVVSTSTYSNNTQQNQYEYQAIQNINYAPKINYQYQGYQQPTMIKKEQPKYNFVDYYGKEIQNDLIKRTDIIGNYHLESTTFDDYFEKHTEKFFTPEINEMIFYYTPGYIHGLQFIYRDPWGKYDKETYKGNVQLPKNVNPKECQQAKLTFDYDDFPKEIYIDGEDHISYIKIVSSKNKKLEVGKKTSTGDLKNQVLDLTRILGVGGTFTSCLNSIYFYYL